jgi:hypothetical protein
MLVIASSMRIIAVTLAVLEMLRILRGLASERALGGGSPAAAAAARVDKSLACDEVGGGAPVLLNVPRVTTGGRRFGFGGT